MSRVRKVFVGLLFVLMIVSVTLPWRRIPEYNIETDYGLPFIWGTQILTEQALLIYPNGTLIALDRVRMRETWRVNPTHLLFDILFWSGLMTITAISPMKLPKLRIPNIRITIDEKDEKMNTCQN